MPSALRQLCCFLLLAGSAGWSESAANQASGTPKTTTITSASRLVLVDVVVTDKSGKPVHGLKAGDFAVTEDGRSQQIRGFEERGQQMPSRAAAVIPNLPPNTYTNYISSHESGAVNIVLFDSLNTDRQNLAFARQQLLQYLAKLPNETRVALFTLDGRLHLVHGFTDDPSALMEAAQQLASTPSPIMRKAREVSEEKALAAETGATKNPAMYRSLAGFLWSEYEGKIESRTEMTMQALDELAHNVAVFPGRKNLIWISGGIPFDPTDTAPQLQKTAALLAATDIAVYPVDVRGVAYLGADAAAPSSTVFAARGGDYSSTTGQGDELLGVRQTMMDMARLTGGQAYYNRNDLASEVDDIVSAGASYYILAYRPQKETWDGKFRKITVKPLKAGLKVQCRPGYYAVPDPFRSPDIDRTFALAMQPGVPPSTTLVIQARVLPPDAPDKATQVDFLVDMHDLTLLQSADHLQKPDVMFVAAAWDRTGKAQGSVSGTYQQVLDAGALKTLMRTGLHLQHQFQLSPGTYDLRVGVVDRLSGKIGTIDVPLTVESKVARN